MLSLLKKNHNLVCLEWSVLLFAILPGILRFLGKHGQLAWGGRVLNTSQASSSWLKMFVSGPSELDFLLAR